MKHLQSKHKLTLIISSIVVVVLILASAITWYVLDQQHYKTALDACSMTLTRAKAAQGKVATTLASGTVKSALAVKEDKVADKNTVTMLHNLAARKLDKPKPCSGSYDTLQQAIKANKTLDNQASMLSEELTKAASSVNTSVTVKQHNDMIAQLNTTIADALTTLKDSEHKVADGKTRETLTQRIDTARKTVADSKSTVQSLQAAQQALTAAQDAVKKSAQQYQQQQQQKAAQAATARRAAAQRQYNRTYQHTNTSSHAPAGPPTVTRLARDHETQASCPHTAIYHDHVWCTPSEAASQALMQKALDEAEAEGNVAPCEVKFFHGCKYADGSIAP